jgi:hypothetical protein
MLFRCVFTVCSPIDRSRATSALRSPWRDVARTSSSRGDSAHRRPAQLLRHLRLQARRQPHLAAGDRADGVHEVLDGEALEHHRARPLRIAATASAGTSLAVSTTPARVGERLDVGEGAALHLQIEQQLIAGRLRQQRGQRVDAVGLADDVTSGSDLSSDFNPGGRAGGRRR